MAATQFDEKTSTVSGDYSLKQAVKILGEPQIREGYIEVEDGPRFGTFVKAPDHYVWLGRNGYLSLQFTGSPFMGFMERNVDPRIMATVIVTARLLGARP